MFALGSQYIREDDKKAEHFKLGEDMTSTCYRSYDATRTKLGPEIIRVNNNGDFDPRSGQYKLRPEVCQWQWGVDCFYQSIRRCWLRIRGARSFQRTDCSAKGRNRLLCPLLAIDLPAC
jgi:hypothetical protein